MTCKLLGRRRASIGRRTPSSYTASNVFSIRFQSSGSAKRGPKGGPLLHHLEQDWIGVHWRPFPPALLRLQLENREVQMRRRRNRISRRSNVADHVAGRDSLPFVEAVGVMVQMRV